MIGGKIISPPPGAAKADGVRLRKAILAGTRAVAAGVARDTRSAIVRAMPKAKRLGKLIRRKEIGRGTADVTQSIKSYALYRRPSGEVDLVALYGSGGVITGARGQWLAIPTPKAPRVKRGAALPYPAFLKQWGSEAGSIAKGGRIYAGPRATGGRIEIWYVLVKRVAVRKRYDLGAPVAKHTAKWGEYIRREVEKSDLRAGRA